MSRRLCALALLLFLAGCGSRRPPADIDRGRAAVVAVLNSWKANEPPAKLKSLPDPVEFSDELRASYELTAYELGNVDASDKDVIRYAVKLSLRDKKGKPSGREVVYSVALRSPVVVARDPYY
jgi:hypothetical protein